MQPVKLSEVLEKMDTNRGCCPEDEHGHGGGAHHGHDHSQDAFSLTWAIIGGVLVVNSILAQNFFYRDEPIIATISAIAGALILAFPIWLTAVKDVLAGRNNMNELVALALLAAFVAQKYQEAGIIAFFMLLAIYIEQRTAIGATQSIESLIRLTPSVAKRLKDDGSEEDVRALDLAVGDVVRVRPGENFPVDGVIVTGSSSVNQASITGESLPVDKMEGGEVFAGTENLTGSVDIRVTKVGSDTTLGQVRGLIEAAEMTRLPIMRLVDRYVVYYTPTILMIAAIVWFFSQDLIRVVMVLVIACPCALVLATPSAVVAAIASAARLGVLIKNVAHIEVIAGIKAVVFDKTGTLTSGVLEVSRLTPAPGVELADLLQAAAAAESRSNHPAAKAMRRLAEEAKLQWNEPTEFREIVGRGVEANVDGDVIRVGRESWMRDLGLDTGEAHQKLLDDGDESQRMSIIFVSKGEQVLGWIGLQDAIRDGAADTVNQLHELGVRDCAMVTGDNEAVAKVVARKVGIRQISAECLPQQKVDFVQSVKGRGLSVAVVGDGVNDAPALAAGDIGIAMGAIGSDVAINSASIALMNNDLRRIPFLVELSRKTRAIIHQNLAFGAFVIVGGMMLFIFGADFLDEMAGRIGVGGATMQAIMASILHVASTFVVIFNSARLVRFGEELQPLPHGSESGTSQPAGGRPTTGAPAAEALA